jgi:hypothetical protein
MLALITPLISALGVPVLLSLLGVFGLFFTRHTASTAQALSDVNTTLATVVASQQARTQIDASLEQAPGQAISPAVTQSVTSGNGTPAQPVGNAANPSLGSLQQLWTTG